MKKVNVLESVQNSVSSIFSKEDVIALINSIDESNFDVKLISRKLQDLQSTISYEFQNLNSDEVVDYYSVEFSIGYQNRIEVEDMNINIERLTEIVEGAIEEFDRELENLEENEEVVEAIANNEL
jgi:predicted unusual protein kinase regulating ubiquinone biosynthesis (AarF/ABC1/UbiB family)